MHGLRVGPLASRALLAGAACAGASAAVSIHRGSRKSSSGDGQHCSASQRPSLKLVAVASPAEAHKDVSVGPVVQACAGAIAGCVARCLVAPLDVVKIRLQVQLEPAAGGKYKGMVHAFQTIVREEGLRGLWRGTVPALLLWVPYTAIQFTALDQFNQMCVRLRIDEGSDPPLPFLGGAVAAATATMASYPLDLLRTVMAAQGEPRVFRTMGDVVRHQLVEIIPYAGLQFGTYSALRQATARWNAAEAERAQRSLTAQTGPSGRSAASQPARNAVAGPAPPPAPVTGFQTFLCGIGAGSFSKILLHPLDVVKKRFQVAGFQRSAAYGAAIQPTTYRNMMHCLGTILAKEGSAGLYKGLLPNLLKAAPASGTTFFVYEGIIGLYRAVILAPPGEGPLAFLGAAGAEKQAKEEEKPPSRRRAGGAAAGGR